MPREEAQERDDPQASMWRGHRLPGESYARPGEVQALAEELDHRVVILDVRAAPRGPPHRFRPATTSESPMTAARLSWSSEARWGRRSSMNRRFAPRSRESCTAGSYTRSCRPFPIRCSASATSGLSRRSSVPRLEGEPEEADALRAGRQRLLRPRSRRPRATSSNTRRRLAPSCSSSRRGRGAPEY